MSPILVNRVGDSISDLLTIFANEGKLLANHRTDLGNGAH